MVILAQNRTGPSENAQALLEIMYRVSVPIKDLSPFSPEPSPDYGDGSG